MKDYTILFEAIITLLIALVTTFVVPYIKSKVSAEDLAEIVKWVKIAVEAAEMIFKESGMGEKKKEYVKILLKSYGIKYNPAQINALIESAVLELKKEFKHGSD